VAKKEEEGSGDAPKESEGDKKSKEQMEEAMRAMQRKTKLMLIKELSDTDLAAAEAELAKLREFEDAEAPVLGRKSEMLFNLQDHRCNVLIKQGLEQLEGGLKKTNAKTGMVYIIKKAEDAVEYNEASLTSLNEIEETKPEDPKVKAKREEQNAKHVKKCKEKSERRKYLAMTNNIAGFANAGDLEKRHDLQDTRFAITFGLGFITVMFLGFLSGYLIARKVFGWEQIDCLLFSLFVGIMTLITEMLLMIFRIDKFTKIKDRERKRLKID